MRECISCRQKTFDDEKEVCINCGSGMTLYNSEEMIFFHLTFWEKQIVWNKRFVVVKTDKDPLTLTIQDLEQPEFDIDWIDVLDTLYDNVEEIRDIEIVDRYGQPIQEEE